MYKIGICDDEVVQVDLMKKYLIDASEDKNIDIEIYTANSGEEFIKLNKEHELDAVFLDIEMSGMDGLELGRILRDQNDQLVIVYITGYRDYALESYSIKAFDYIIKPLTKDKFLAMLKQVSKRVDEVRIIRDTDKNFIIKRKEGFTSINYSDIFYFEKDGKNINVICREEVHSYRSTIKEVKSNLESDDFIQCHQGYLVNMGKVTNRKDSALFCGDIKTLVPIGKTYRKSVLESIEKKLLTRW